MAPEKRSKKGEGESRREELAPGVAIATTQGEEGGPSKKRASRKKATAPSKTASQIREELNLEPITTEPQVEQEVVDQVAKAAEQPNVPLDASEEVDSEESEKDSDREGPRHGETAVVRFKSEFREMQATIASLVQQNQMLMELAQGKLAKGSSSDGSKPTYMKNVPKPPNWDTKDRRNIEAFLTEYETYCNASGYIGDEVRVRSFGSFLKEGAAVSFAA